MKRVVADTAAKAYVDEALRTPSAEADELPNFVKAFADKIPDTYGAPVRRPATVE